MKEDAVALSDEYGKLFSVGEVRYNGHGDSKEGHTWTLTG